MKISKIKIGILLIFVIIILIENISYAIYKTNTNIEEDIAILTEEEQETLNLINEYRKQNNLEELKPISKLQEVAEIKAKDLVENEYFSHTSERLGTPFEMLKTNGIDYILAGENLAGNINAKRAVQAWINSPTHKANILDKDFKYTGISVIDSPIYGKVFVQIFIKC